MNMDVAEQQVQAAINAASNLLPSDLPAPPVYNKVNPADTPVLTLAISSKTMPLPKLNDLVDTRVAQKLAQISGWAWSASPAASARRCGSRSTSTLWRPTASTSTMCAP